MNTPRVHDRAVLDALEAMETVALTLDVWRITRAGLNAIRGSTAPARWSPGGLIEVLYTSLQRDGALTEIGFRHNLAIFMDPAAAASLEVQVSEPVEWTVWRSANRR